MNKENKKNVFPVFWSIRFGRHTKEKDFKKVSKQRRYSKSEAIELLGGEADVGEAKVISASNQNLGKYTIWYKNNKACLADDEIIKTSFWNLTTWLSSGLSLQVKHFLRK